SSLGAIPRSPGAPLFPYSTLFLSWGGELLGPPLDQLHRHADLPGDLLERPLLPDDLDEPPFLFCCPAFVALMHRRTPVPFAEAKAKAARPLSQCNRARRGSCERKSVRVSHRPDRPAQRGKVDSL